MKRLIFCLIIIFGILLPVNAVFAADTVVVVIDPGHGGLGEGDAVTGALYNDGLCEKDVDLVTALAMKRELMKYNNVEVYLTREDDRQLSLDERVDFAYSVGADVMISCHYNASEHHIFYGSEIFTSAFGNCYATGNGLGRCIMDRWVGNGLDMKGIKVRIGNSGSDYYGVIRHGREVGLPVIIIEHGYLDNHIDYERLGTYEDWERMGRLDAEGIADYYGLSRDRVYDDVFPTVNVEIPQESIKPDVTEPEDVTLTITDLNLDTSEVTYEIKASEPDGRLMYYGLALGEPVDTVPGDYADLMLWEEGKDSMTGTFGVPTGYTGKITARVYNIYELYTDSMSEDVDMQALIDERDALLEEEAKRAEEEAKKEQERARQRAEQKKIEEERAAEKEKVGDYSFLLGGREGKGGKNNKGMSGERILVIAVIVIIIFVAVTCVLIYVFRKTIIKYIKDREGM
ncbi:MAG: N-acetylmuramoyl-L-alanine amidase [Lachnospiraceae bacterium]|nr:N-acetylmuramoyl-L-alanine amidase [Lachnospiraceae bacterium]